MFWFEIKFLRNISGTCVFTLFLLLPKLSRPQVKIYLARFLISQDHSTRNFYLHDIHTFPILIVPINFIGLLGHYVSEWHTVSISEHVQYLWEILVVKETKSLTSYLLSIMTIPSQLLLLPKFYHHFATGIALLSNNLDYQY